MTFTKTNCTQKQTVKNMILQFHLKQELKSYPCKIFCYCKKWKLTAKNKQVYSLLKMVLETGMKNTLLLMEKLSCHHGILRVSLI